MDRIDAHQERQTARIRQIVENHKREESQFFRRTTRRQLISRLFLVALALFVMLFVMLLVVGAEGT
jgi:hypothetical protein